MITKISIKNFRSIGQQDIKSNRITTLIGNNDAGKSNVLRALNLFFNGETDIGNKFSFSRDFNQNSKIGLRKAKEIQISIEFQLPRSYIKDEENDKIFWHKTWREEHEGPFTDKRNFLNGEDFPSRSKIEALLDRIKFTYIPAIKDTAFFADLQGRLYDVLASVAATPLRESAQVFERQLQTQLGELLQSITEVFRGNTSMRLPENLRKIFEGLEINSEGIPLSRRGDGIKIRHIPMLLRFIAEKQDQILNRGGIRYTHLWGFEEPENNVEMSSCFQMAQNLCDVIKENDNYQLFMTTHSPIIYRIPDPSKNSVPSVTTLFVEKIDYETCVTSKNQHEIDETMGLMPIIVPYIEQAKLKYDQISKDLEEAKIVANNNIPTIFVEGESDKVVFGKIIEIFFPDDAGKFRIHCGNDEEYGSVNALVSRSTAWLLEMRHRPANGRTRAVSIFDLDEAGIKAKAELQSSIERFNINTSNHFKVIPLPVPARLVELRRSGFKLPIDLESYYSDSLWRLAKKSKWLEERENISSLFSAESINKLIKAGENPIKTLSSEDKMRIEYKFSMNGKRKASQYILSKKKQEAKEYISELQTVMDSILRFLRASE